MIELRADIDALAKRLGASLSRRLPQATARALTRLSFDARDAVRRELPQRFTLRRPWVSQGIVARGASPTRLMAVVGSRDAFMVWQERGGSRPGPNAIPLGRLAELAKTQVVPRREWPGQMLKRKGVFVRRGVVFERVGREARPVWRLKRAQRVAPRLGMRETVERVVAERLAQRFGQAWQEAR